MTKNAAPFLPFGRDALLHGIWSQVSDGALRHSETGTCRAGGIRKLRRSGNQRQLPADNGTSQKIFLHEKCSTTRLLGQNRGATLQSSMMKGPMKMALARLNGPAAL